MTTGIPFVGTGSYPVREGNSVRLLVDGIPAFRRIRDAIDAAERSVWATVTFMWPSFEMPDGRGTTLDVLDRAAARGVDVRVIFWRPDDDMTPFMRNAFWGSPEHVAQLDERRSGVNVRWDRAAPGFCQHQKSWLIDAGTDSETAFVGGINLNPHSLVLPGHAGEGQNHDAFLELRGPSVVDVHHNFVQQWNEASEATGTSASDDDARAIVAAEWPSDKLVDHQDGALYRQTGERMIVNFAQAFRPMANQGVLGLSSAVVFLSIDGLTYGSI